VSILPVIRQALVFPDLLQERVQHVGGGLDAGLRGFRRNAIRACCFAGLEGLDGLDDLSLGWSVGINVK
jgi:hypothetical protein